MRTLALALWFLLVILAAAALGTRSAQAQCSGGCYTTVNNKGQLTYWVCVAPCGYCGGGADAGCEKDNCSNASCGSGSTQYCIYEPNCGMFPRCLNETCI